MVGWGADVKSQNIKKVHSHMKMYRVLWNYIMKDEFLGRVAMIFMFSKWKMYELLVYES